MRFAIGVLVAALLIAGGVTGEVVYQTRLTAQVSPTPAPSARTSVSTPTPSPAPTEAPTPVPTEAPTATPAAGQPTDGPTALVGTYWACESDQSDSGVVDHAVDAGLRAAGGVRSRLCQKDMTLEPGAHAFRVPVGHFTPFRFCGVTVANIIDPYQGQVAPSGWIAADERLYNLDWTRGAPSGTC